MPNKQTKNKQEEWDNLEFLELARECEKFLRNNEVWAVSLGSVAGRMAIFIRKILTKAHNQALDEALEAVGYNASPLDTMGREELEKFNVAVEAVNIKLNEIRQRIEKLKKK